MLNEKHQIFIVHRAIINGYYCHHVHHEAKCDIQKCSNEKNMKVQDDLTVTLFYYLYLSHETRDLMPCFQQAVTASQLDVS